MPRPKKTKSTPRQMGCPLFYVMASLTATPEGRWQIADVRIVDVPLEPMRPFTPPMEEIQSPPIQGLAPILGIWAQAMAAQAARTQEAKMPPGSFAMEAPPARRKRARGV